MRFTALPEAGRLFAILLGTPAGTTLTLRDLRAAPGSRVRRLGGGPVAWRQDGPDLALELPDRLEPASAHALAIEPWPT